MWSTFSNTMVVKSTASRTTTALAPITSTIPTVMAALSPVPTAPPSARRRMSPGLGSDLHLMISHINTVNYLDTPSQQIPLRNPHLLFF